MIAEWPMEGDIELARESIKERFKDPTDRTYTLGVFDELLAFAKEAREKIERLEAPATCHQGHKGHPVTLWNCPTCSDMIAERLRYFEEKLKRIWVDTSIIDSEKVRARDILDEAPPMPNVDPAYDAFMAVVLYCESEEQRSDITVEGRDLVAEMREEFARRARMIADPESKT